MPPIVKKPTIYCAQKTALNLESEVKWGSLFVYKNGES